MNQLSSLQVVLTILSTVGMTYIATEGSIFQKLREYMVKKHNKISDMFTCSVCNGFHSGWINILGVMFIPYFYVFQFACIGSLMSVIFVRFIKRLNIYK